MKQKVMLSSLPFLDNAFGKLWDKLCEETLLNFYGKLNWIIGFYCLKWMQVTYAAKQEETAVVPPYVGT